MEGLTTSSSKIFAEYNSSRGFLSSGTLSNIPKKCLFGSRKLVSLHLTHSFTLHFKAIESLGSPSFSSETQPGWDNANYQAQATCQLKTVHVKLQLQKECVFGQRFLLVGDDPILGLWDPSNAIPLEWSDGHIWAVELDLPVGKSVQFKFILEGTVAGEVLWQPGPDRLVQTWETKNIIIVSEDWENAEIQKITEEPMLNPLMESYATENLPYANVEGLAKDNERLIVAEKISFPEEEPMASAISEQIDSEYTTLPKEDPVVIAGNTSIVAENITHPKEYMADLGEGLQTLDRITYSQEENMPNANIEFISAQSTPESNGGVKSSEDENQGIYEGGFVLVPGLTPLPTMTTQDSSSQVVEKGNNSGTSVQAGEADDNSASEKNQLPGKQEPGGDTIQEDRSKIMLMDGNEGELHVDGLKEKPQITKEQEDSSSQPNNGEDGDGNILLNDIQWGRKTLSKFLTSLGFL
ncbi:uncharacterized protein LOC122058140 isoform X2 [Macadamia integrifolia]|uniref:uncharacterized protein LOC122058140 isoform X2 n=1 Tax=Macadamia integrifolia TaxID=60698 RepID=UPI001C52C90A|nr:uncharacterized protein LOC122058140 isoform X2 [Macadamia integrifolia]